METRNSSQLAQLGKPVAGAYQSVHTIDCVRFHQSQAGVFCIRTLCYAEAEADFLNEKPGRTSLIEMQRQQIIFVQGNFVINP